MNNILSTRCDPTILANMKKAAKAEKKSLRQLIEQMREQYETDLVRKQIKESYKNMSPDMVAMADEDLHSYFTTLVNHENM
jgi:DNA replicative helicase MCM subunit Mcm2 (Cdc46/Mcm family)